jgi:hypothetical protein
MEEIIKKIKEFPRDIQYSIVSVIVEHNNFSITEMVALKEYTMKNTLEQKNESITTLAYKSMGLIFLKLTDKKQIESLRSDLKNELVKLQIMKDF